MPRTRTIVDRVYISPLQGGSSTNRHPDQLVTSTLLHFVLQRSLLAHFKPGKFTGPESSAAAEPPVQTLLAWVECDAFVLLNEGRHTSSVDDNFVRLVGYVRSPFAILSSQARAGHQARMAATSANSGRPMPRAW